MITELIVSSLDRIQLLGISIGTKQILSVSFYYCYPPLQVLILEDQVPGISNCQEKYVPSNIIVHSDGGDEHVTSIDIYHVTQPGHAKMEVNIGMFVIDLCLETS